MSNIINKYYNGDPIAYYNATLINRDSNFYRTIYFGYKHNGEIHEGIYQFVINRLKKDPIAIALKFIFENIKRTLRSCLKHA